MSGDDQRISIWFFIGALLAVYGLLILGAGVWNLLYPSGLPQAMSHLHPALWWGALLLVLGAVYCWKFWPFGRRKS
ncbi:MAG: hypothetical protein RMI94_09815 [Bryobacterales bacterium]|nr:hypothetical protein [Bryobacterales bacterium]